VIILMTYDGDTQTQNTKHKTRNTKHNRPDTLEAISKNRIWLKDIVEIASSMIWSTAHADI
jgi:hypothetical protein